jgi:hypothetical protein
MTNNVIINSDWVMEEEQKTRPITYPPLTVTTNYLESELHRPIKLLDRFNLNFLKRYKSYDLDDLEKNKDINGLFDIIKYKDIDYKIWALRVLGDIKDPKCIVPLILLLKNDDYLRNSVIDTIVKVGGPAVDPLIASLDLTNYNINWAAINALGELKDDRAIKPLIKMLKYKDLNTQASVALGKIGNNAVDSLIGLLYGYDSNAQINAIYALSHIRDTKAIEPIVELLDDEDLDVRLEAYQALQRMGVKAKQRLKEVIPLYQEFNEHLYNEKKTDNFYERLIKIYMHEEKLLSDRTSIYLLFNSLLFAGFVQLYLKSYDTTLPSTIHESIYLIGLMICLIAFAMYLGQFSATLSIIINITQKKIGINVIETENFWYPGKEKLYRTVSKYGLSPIGLSNIHKKVLSLIKDNNNFISLNLISLVYLIWLVLSIVIMSDYIGDYRYKSLILFPLGVIGLGAYFVLILYAYKKINSLLD